MATIYIGPLGNDSTGAGTSGNPYLTLSKAVTVASNNDTIICLNGTYTMASTTISKTLTIQAQTTGSVIWDGGGGNTKWTFSGGVTVNVTGFIFQNIAITSGGFLTSSSNASGTINFTSCIFKTITLASGATFINVTIVSGNTTFTFTTCLFNDIKGSASVVSFSTTGESNTRLTFTGCTLYFVEPTNRVSAFLSSGGGSYAALTLKNTIIYNGTGSTFSLSTTPSSQAYTYSCLYLTTGFTTSGTGVITSDPLFVDVASSNFNLRPTSPCIDTGSL